MPDPLPLALTMGEPGGIGPDITILAWRDRRTRRLPAFYCYADPGFLAERAKTLGVDCPIEQVDPSDAADCFARALPVVGLDATVDGEAGSPNPENAAAVIEAIAKAVGDIRSGVAGAIVTNPISKRALYAAGFQHPGHTEFLGTLSAAWTGQPGRPVMMLVGPDLRAVPVTIHIPLRDVAAALNQDLIVETGRIVVRDLRERFAIAAPRLAITGLNPHAGEAGTLGVEERETIGPAVDALRAEGIAATGPHSADALFHEAARARYDAAICMYHDQALIPAKTLSFADTVNVTLGLAFIRTSPDHGTAFDIAGTGKADPSSLAAALRLAAELCSNQSATSNG
ncbi:4-hydroxythreonine-4-phosphate dehydrogenase PdxA [Bauldia sp.]|uniref:4-hydroxythreonine-4-phosphate dehydrogenase PdxA n=1 Tax=Bauldia sp. TaxID=2575872 RepID=UPI003BAC362A